MEKAHARRDLPAYYRVNRAIHDRLNAIAGNPVLAHTYRTLNARLHALRFRSNLERRQVGPGGGGTSRDDRGTGGARRRCAT